MKKYSIILIIASLCWSITTTAQLSEGGIPPSFKHAEVGFLKSKKEPLIAPSTRSIDELLAEDDLIPKIGYPQRIATIIPVDVDINKTGDWSKLNDGSRIWRQKITAPNAKAIIISYEELYIPKGAKLYLYDKSKEQVLGAYTHNTNPTLAEFSTEETYGDEVTLEYVASTESDQAPVIKINRIGYIYGKEAKIETRAQSKPCMIDVNCAQGADWQTEKRGVTAIRMEFSDGWYVCSGSLVNNTAKNRKPYILSADHCFYSGSEVANYNTSQYRFDRERVSCNSSDTLVNKTLVGATLQARSPLVGGGDGLLLLLKTNVPDEWKPYYNGWDRTNTPATSGVIIHHPNGDFKKITTYTNKPTPVSNVLFEEGTTGQNSHWKVVYSSSITEGGSSGSPIFNQNKLIVGTLTGGSSDCGSIESKWPDYYGRMSYHWDQYRNSNLHMKLLLDPLGSNVQTLAGLDYYGSSIGEEVATNPIVIFPLPFDAELNINANSIIREVRVFDLSGRAIFAQENYTSSTIAIPSAAWNNGAYTIFVKTDDGNSTHKVIK